MRYLCPIRTLVLYFSAHNEFRGRLFSPRCSIQRGPIGVTAGNLCLDWLYPCPPDQLPSRRHVSRSRLMDSLLPHLSRTVRFLAVSEASYTFRVCSIWYKMAGTTINHFLIGGLWTLFGNSVPIYTKPHEKMNPPAKRYATSEDWTRLQAVIMRVYLDDDKTVEEVKAYMEEHHEFFAT